MGIAIGGRLVQEKWEDFYEEESLKLERCLNQDLFVPDNSVDVFNTETI